jgi:hypothetical protein
MEVWLILIGIHGLVAGAGAGAGVVVAAAVAFASASASVPLTVRTAKKLGPAQYLRMVIGVATHRAWRFSLRVQVWCVGG